MATSTRYRVVLVDDHALFRGGMKGLLKMEGSCDVVGEAANGAEFLELIRTIECDVVLLDIDMPVMDGMEAARIAIGENPALKIIALSMHGAEEYYFRMVELGVKGFMLKNSEIDEVLAAIKTVVEGGSYFSPELLDALVGSLRSNDSNTSEESLSEREREILLLICKGLSNQEIGDKLFISKRTVDKHRANILEKTGCKNTANLVVFAIKNSLVEI